MNDYPSIVIPWKDGEIDTIGELIDVIASIVRAGDQEEAFELRGAYRQVTENADSSLGYAMGYLPHDQMVDGLRLFEVQHPFFGAADQANEITPAQAFKIGQEEGTRWHKQ